MARNGYFKIRITDSGRFVEIYPPEDGGEAVDLNELKEYLAARNYPVDLVKLKSTVESAKDEMKPAKLDTGKGFPEGESMKLTFSDDSMTAYARFYAPSEGGNELSVEEIKNDLKVKGVVFGILEESIVSYIANRDYCTTYIVAEGDKVIEGENGSIAYFFNTNPDTRPKLNEDGTVDFFNLNVMNPCSEGQVLARLTSAVPGSEGKTVFGERVTPREVSNPPFKSGNNTRVSEDGLELVSLVNGNVTLIEDTVFVKDIYEVQDVDTSTGNIDYKGDIKVMGSVRSGFSVKASGTVEVKGVVEGARIEAGEDIIIGRGMNGMGKGELKAGRNVIAKFFENSRVKAGGYVHAEAIINSEIVAKTDVEVSGKKGNITGGTVRAMHAVEAKTIGSEMGVETQVEVGADPEIKQKVQSLEADISKIRKALETIEPVLTAYTQRLKRGEKLNEDQVAQMKQLNMKYKALSGALEKEKAVHETYTDKLKDTEGDAAVVKVSGIAYPGTVITIMNAHKELKSEAQHSRFVKEGVDVRIKALY